MRETSFYIGVTVGALSTLALCLILYSQRQGSVDQAWEIFEKTERGARAILRAGKIPEENLINDNKQAFQFLTKRNEIISIIVPETSERDISRIIWENDIVLLQPLEMKIGGQRSVNQYYIRLCELGFVKEKLNATIGP